MSDWLLKCHRPSVLQLGASVALDALPAFITDCNDCVQMAAEVCVQLVQMQ